MSWNLHDEETFETVRRLTEEMIAQRRRPAPADGPDTKQRVWGELRSFAQRGFSGGERWGEWCGLFEVFEGDERTGAIRHLSRGWGHAVEDLDALHHEFCYHVVARNIEVLRRAGFTPLDDPAPPEVVEAWEEAHDTDLPSHVRRFFLEVSARLTPEKMGTQWRFHGLRDERAPLMPLATSELSSDAHDYGGFVRLLGRALHHFSHQEGAETISVSNLHVSGIARDVREAARTLVTLHSHYDHNHPTFVITKGPRTGYMLRWNGMLGGGILDPFGEISFLDMHVAEWLLCELYYEWIMLGEIWPRATYWSSRDLPER